MRNDESQMINCDKMIRRRFAGATRNQDAAIDEIA
jgi:hypothetical protein